LQAIRGDELIKHSLFFLKIYSLSYLFLDRFLDGIDDVRLCWVLILAEEVLLRTLEDFVPTGILDCHFDRVVIEPCVGHFSARASLLYEASCRCQLLRTPISVGAIINMECLS